jgi:serine protease SohB
MDFLQDYGLFLAKTITVVIALLALIAGFTGISGRSRGSSRERLEVTALNERFSEFKSALEHKLLDRKQARRLAKQRAKSRKRGETQARRVFVVDFDGDIRASQVESLRQEVSGILTVAGADDEVVVRLQSPGGLVPNYGLAAAELARLKGRVRQLTIAIDRVAASGGYLMACVGDRILASPFAIIGSIGVVAQLPNFHRLLKKHDVDVELLTAGEYKRTLTLFGENTDKGRQKLQEELEQTHSLFKDFIRRFRPSLDVDRVATGEYWLGERALALGLIDEVRTSDDYLLALSEQAQLLRVRYRRKQSLGRRLSLSLETALREWRGL